MDAAVPMLVFFGFAGLALTRYHVAVRAVRDEREADLLEQLAQPGDLMSLEVAASQLTLQVKDDQGGITVGAALAAHVNQRNSVLLYVPRESLSKSSGEGNVTR